MKENLKEMTIEELFELWPEFKEKKENQDGVFILTSGKSGGVIGFPDSIYARKILFDGDKPLIEKCEVKHNTELSGCSDFGYSIICRDQESADRAIMKIMEKYELRNYEIYHGNANEEGI